MQSSAVAAPPCVEPAPASPTRMEEELAAPSTSTDKTDSMDVDGESKKLLGLGQKHLVMGNIPAAVNAFQEAASLLGKKYGETADECAEAFFYYGKSLLELARMENGVLGNALEGVQVEEEGEKAEGDSALPAVDEEAREELREQVYNAMEEKEEAQKSKEESPVVSEKERKEEDVEMEDITEQKPTEEAIAVKEEKPEEKTEASVEKEVTSEEQKQQVAVGKEATKEEAAVEEMGVEKEQNTVPEEKVAEATEERMTEVSGEEAKAAVEEAEAGESAAEEQGEVGEQTAEAAEKASVVAQEEAAEEQAEAAVEEKVVAQEVTAEVQAAAAAEQKGAAEGETEAAEQKKVEEKQEPVEAAMEEKAGESKETESSKEPVPTEGKEPSDDMEEKAEVAAKVEKEEKNDDLMEEGEGAKVEKEEKDDLMEEGEVNYLLHEEINSLTTMLRDLVLFDVICNQVTQSLMHFWSLQESEEDEIGNLELAWDMLELAKVIYKRQETKEAQLHAAQAHLKLGEVSIESENYTQAIEEFQACLALQQKYLEAHDRLLAESHYQLALAYHYNSQFDEAVLQFGKSIEVIDKRMAMLTERMQKTENGSPEDEKEIEELRGLLPEIREKIEDSKESQKSARVAELALKATLAGTTSGFAKSEDSGSVSTIPVRKAADGASQCVTDISHLVRKKRKPEDETHQGDNEAKKSKAEPAVNGGGGGGDVPSGKEVAEKMEEETEKRPQAESGAAVESTV
ncbi:nuclear autoantigenic sperm protein [Patagioenas fasciata monilis]|uniref:Nuclear autoantigenic sperm protein n=2 Tax=Columbidae TaxID=8930 RepID=A0A1V4JX35_PATFA|nr:nuclear autoantigenic sperm protein [Patagioenas fasciata monilis]